MCENFLYGLLDCQTNLKSLLTIMFMCVSFCEKIKILKLKCSCFVWWVSPVSHQTQITISESRTQGLSKLCTDSKTIGPGSTNQAM